MKIVFFCPPVSVINGGIKHIFRMAECLIAQGRDAVVFEQSGQRPTWFASTAPVIGQSIFNNIADHLYVLPEDQPHILRDFAKLPNRKVIYSQNHFYAALGLPDGGSFADFGVDAILCSSQTIRDHSLRRHPALPAYVVPCAVDQALFRPAPMKTKTISFMPRKRPVEAAYIRDMFRFTHPEFKDWHWQEINNVGEAEAARHLADSAVFLSLSRLEGFGLTPLEAMAAGCIVAGFTGIGGREYATEQNGFWCAEDDYEAAVNALAAAARLYDSAREPNSPALAAHRAAAAQTIAAYSPATFAEGVRAAWNALLPQG